MQCVQSLLSSRLPTMLHDALFCRCLTPTPPLGVLQLPASLFAYRKQQHRWSAGPTQLIKLAMREVGLEHSMLVEHALFSVPLTPEKAAVRGCMHSFQRMAWDIC